MPPWKAQEEQNVEEVILPHHRRLAATNADHASHLRRQNLPSRRLQRELMASVTSDSARLMVVTRCGKQSFTGLFVAHTRFSSMVILCPRSPDLRAEPRRELLRPGCRLGRLERFPEPRVLSDQAVIKGGESDGEITPVSWAAMRVQQRYEVA